MTPTTTPPSIVPDTSVETAEEQSLRQEAMDAIIAAERALAGVTDPELHAELADKIASLKADTRGVLNPARFASIRAQLDSVRLQTTQAMAEDQQHLRQQQQHFMDLSAEGKLIAEVYSQHAWFRDAAPEVQKLMVVAQENFLHNNPERAAEWKAAQAATPEQKKAFRDVQANGAKELAWLKEHNPEEAKKVEALIGQTEGDAKFSPKVVKAMHHLREGKGSEAALDLAIEEAKTDLIGLKHDVIQSMDPSQRKVLRGHYNDPYPSEEAIAKANQYLKAHPDINKAPEEIQRTVALFTMHKNMGMNTAAHQLNEWMGLAKAEEKAEFLNKMADTDATLDDKVKLLSEFKVNGKSIMPEGKDAEVRAALSMLSPQATVALLMAASGTDMQGKPLTNRDGSPYTPEQRDKQLAEMMFRTMSTAKYNASDAQSVAMAEQMRMMQEYGNYQIPKEPSYFEEQANKSALDLIAEVTARKAATAAKVTAEGAEHVFSGDVTATEKSGRKFGVGVERTVGDVLHTVIGDNAVSNSIAKGAGAAADFVASGTGKRIASTISVGKAVADEHKRDTAFDLIKKGDLGQIAKAWDRTVNGKTFFDQELEDVLKGINGKDQHWDELKGKDGKKTFDLDGDGKVELDEIKKVLAKHGVTKLDQLDTNHDGQLESAELVKVMFDIKKKEGASRAK